ncbi:MAG TPA: isoprenylcysteine carboxylmethyltransferase family protein [Gemmatimonadaceae bacterium]|nr:isoprenylcysteine carboxylmethyltransferase family protein [Gemmatimonadaceae bacterium]
MLLFLKNLAFTVLAPGTVAFYLPVAIGTRHGGWGATTLRDALVAAPLLLAGTALYLWCVWDFATFGRGTPAPIDPPRHLVARGAYRWVRNPMYVGVVTAIAGWLVVFHSTVVLAYMAVVAIIIYLFVTLFEEPQLQRRFGDEYKAYCRSVPRWLPRRPRAGASTEM